MNTEQLLKIIGEPVGSIIVAPPFGNATLHRKGFWSCDPCYIWNFDVGIRQAHREAFPWASYEYSRNKNEWREFQYAGATCYARDCSDGCGYFGNTVDAGYVFVFPFDLATESMKDQAQPVAGDCEGERNMTKPLCKPSK